MVKEIELKCAFEPGTLTFPEIASTIQTKVFDHLDAPVLRVGALNCVSPSYVVLEKIYLPDEEKVANQAQAIL